MIYLTEKRLSDEQVYQLSGGQCYDYEEYVEDSLMMFRDRLPEDFHLCNYNTYSKWELNLVAFLNKSKIDLSYDSMYLPVFGFKIAGNAGGIASDFLRNIRKKAWHKISADDLQDMKINKVYRNDRYGCCEPATKQDISVINSYQNVGIGSQASIIETKTKLYADNDNNILVSTYSLTWN